MLLMTALIVPMGALQVAALVVRLLRKDRQAAVLLVAATAIPLIAYMISLC